MAALARFDPTAERVEAFGGDEFLLRHSPHDFRSVTVFFSGELEPVPCSVGSNKRAVRGTCARPGGRLYGGVWGAALCRF